MWILDGWIFLFKDSTWKCSFWTFFIKLWVVPQMWILDGWIFLFKDSTWKCSFWTCFIKLWVGPQMWTSEVWIFLFKDSTWKCSFWTFFIKLWVVPQMWILDGWIFLFEDSTWKCSFWTFFIKSSEYFGPQNNGHILYFTVLISESNVVRMLGSNFEFYKLIQHRHDALICSKCLTWEPFLLLLSFIYIYWSEKTCSTEFFQYIQMVSAQILKPKSNIWKSSQTNWKSFIIYIYNFYLYIYIYSYFYIYI